MTRVIDRVFEHGLQATRVDLAKGIVYGAKIAGMKSLHGRDYSDATYQRATDKYEGQLGYLNHAGGQSGRKRSVEDAFCVFHNPRVLPGQGVFADVHVLDEEDPFARKFLKVAASEDPDKRKAFSFSHDAQVTSRKDPKTGRQLVESIDTVASVDVVARGATTKGIFEGYDMIPLDDDKGEEKDEDGMCGGKPYHHHVANAMHAIATHPTMPPEHKKTKTRHLMHALHGSGMDEGLDGAEHEAGAELQADSAGKQSGGNDIEPKPTSKGGAFKEGADETMSELEQLRLRERVRKVADGFGVTVDDAFLTEAVQEGFDEAVLQLAARQQRQRAREAARPKSISRQQTQPVQESDNEPSLLRWAPGARARMGVQR